MSKQHDCGGSVIRIALAGCGEHSRASHAAPLARYASQHPGEIELVAACDLNVDKANEFCQSFGFVHPYTVLTEMLDAEKIDGCVCVMPMDRIVETGIQLLERQIPCVIEKPLGMSLAEAERLEQISLETKTPHMVSVNRRFMPYLNRARSWIADAGSLRYVRACQVRHARDESDFIWSTAIHVLDALRYVAGEIKDFEVDIQYAAASSAVWYVIELHFESGVTGLIEVLPTAGMLEESYEFFGQNFRTRITAGTGTQRSLECWQNGNLVIDEKARDDDPEDLRNGAYQEAEEFVTALKSGRRPGPEVKDILPSARICFAIADSVNKKKRELS
ncbi:MAG TPA: Gfo/Idh/MocA family oxidoreductase [Pyrinomonadaceae bacterium]|nr:Gfo/Idh/MocA family oxidoreductase [Pyrinomonadaceae bacterium]